MCHEMFFARYSLLSFSLWNDFVRYFSTKSLRQNCDSFGDPEKGNTGVRAAGAAGQKERMWEVSKGLVFVTKTRTNEKR